ncbi:MAG: LytR C-terminal domain-containing protein [Salinibacter sp.]|uniref:LytR C-terminal domain-containing protein n=1 Tax=Salinibacter sp. TaxID=2065818 RepID=UPI0035D410A2
MTPWHSRFTNGLLNVALVIGGGSTLVLLYALVAHIIVTSPAPQRPPSSSPALVGSIVQVEVRNGAGVDGLAARTTRYLRDQGFDVVKTGNHSSFDQKKSMVIDRIGNLDAARKVAEALGIPPDQVHQRVRRQYYLDASVIIGHDYQQLHPFQATTQ